MKKWLLLTIFFNLYAPPHNKIIVSDFCEQVYRRQYCLGRLEKIVTILQKLQKRIPPAVLSFPESLHFNHQELRKAIDAIEKNKSLSPFFACWEKLCDYRDINDEQLVKEFSYLTLFLAQKLQKTKGIPIDMDDIICALGNTTYTEALTLRFYYVNRLTRSLAFLSQIKCCKETLFEEVIIHRNECSCIFESNYPFKHKNILDCIKEMESSCAAPLLLLAQEFNSYKLIHDDLFTKEFLLLVFCAYKNLLTNNALTHNIALKKSTLDTITHLYENIESLPLENILEAIDLLTEELPKLFEHYNDLSDGHWKDRLKKYWWIPPVFIGVIKLGIIFKPHRPKPIYYGPPLPGTS